jgi:predicted transcriptional regulator
MSLEPTEKKLVKDKKVKNILKTIFNEKESGKPGVTISQLSKETGIERHRLTGMLEILVLLGLITMFQIGVMKIVAPTTFLNQIIKYIK